MSKALGPLAYEKRSSNNFLGNGQSSPRRSLSEDTGKAIDEEVKQIVEVAYEQALQILRDNRELLETMTQELLTTEVLEGDELQSLLNQVRPLEVINQN
jgi:cell division protease FtsH